MTPDPKPDLPHRLRRNKIFRVTAWLAVMLTISFLLLSKTRWYQIHHHRNAFSALQRNMWPTKPNTFRSYFSLEAFFWFIHRNTTLEQRIARAGKHAEALLELGYLESRQFPFSPPPGTGAIAALQPYMSQHELGHEYTLTFTNMRIGVLAPAKEMPKWIAILQAYNSQSRTNSVSTP